MCHFWGLCTERAGGSSGGLQIRSCLSSPRSRVWEGFAHLHFAHRLTFLQCLLRAFKAPPRRGPDAGSSPKLALRSITGHRRILETVGRVESTSQSDHWEPCFREAKLLLPEPCTIRGKPHECAASSQSASAAAQLSCRIHIMMLCVKQTLKQQLLMQENLHDLGHSPIVLSPVLRPCREPKFLILDALLAGLLLRSVILPPFRSRLQGVGQKLRSFAIRRRARIWIRQQRLASPQ